MVKVWNFAYKYCKNNYKQTFLYSLTLFSILIGLRVQWVKPIETYLPLGISYYSRSVHNSKHQTL